MVWVIAAVAYWGSAVGKMGGREWMDAGMAFLSCYLSCHFARRGVLGQGPMRAVES